MWVARGHEEGLVDLEAPGAALDGLVCGFLRKVPKGHGISAAARVE